MRLPPEMIITNSRTRVRPDHTSVDLVGRAFWHGSGCACVDIVRGFCCVDLVAWILLGGSCRMDLVARVWMSCVDLVAVSLFIGSCCVGLIVWILCAYRVHALSRSYLSSI